MNLFGSRWRKSSYSGSEGSCVEVAILPAEWCKSSYCGSQGECVEVAVAPSVVGVRDTKDREGGTLVLPAPAWAGFLTSLPRPPSG